MGWGEAEEQAALVVKGQKSLTFAFYLPLILYPNNVFYNLKKRII